MALSDLAVLQARVGLLSAKTLDEADVIRICNEHLLPFATAASVLFFVLGWGLGLVGKLYKVEGLGGSE